MSPAAFDLPTLQAPTFRKGSAPPSGIDRTVGRAARSFLPSEACIKTFPDRTGFAQLPANHYSPANAASSDEARPVKWS